MNWKDGWGQSRETDSEICTTPVGDTREREGPRMDAVREWRGLVGMGKEGVRSIGSAAPLCRFMALTMIKQ